MVKRLVDVNATYEIALGRKRAFGDETKGTSGLKISKTNESRLAAVMLDGESLDDVLSRILDHYEKQFEKNECIFLP
jgi:dsRNA-specific ribonuclease